VRAELAHLAVLHDDGSLADRGGNGAGGAVRREMFDPFAFVVGEFGRRAVESYAQQAPVVAAAYETVARRVADQRQHRAAMQRRGGVGRGGGDIGRQQPHASVAQREGHRGAVAAEGTGRGRRVGRDRTRRRQGLPPGRICEIELHATISGSLRSRASGSRRRGCGR
jgi:hypothetical protein